MSFSKLFVSRSPKNSGCPKVLPLDPNLWDSCDWDKNRSNSPGILSFATQVPGTKTLGTGSPVRALPCGQPIISSGARDLGNLCLPTTSPKARG